MTDACSVLIEGVRCTRPRKSLRNPLCDAHYRQEQSGRLPFSWPVERSPRGSSSIRDEFGRKFCSRCRLWRDTSAFRGGQRTSDTLHAFCRECERSAARRNYYDRGGYTPEMGIFRKFKLREEDYQSILLAQGGACASCGGTPEDRLSVDHDHSCCSGSTTCGQCTRGLLCRNCNLALGLLEDRPERVKSLYDYITKWRP